MSHPHPALVSVLLPVYNGAQHLAEAIASILNQTASDFDLVIVDDASTDASLQVIQGFVDPRIRVISNEVNQGLSTTLNIGIAASTGQFIARQDQDDISVPHRLEVLVEALEADPECGAVCSSKLLIDSSSESRGKRKAPQDFQALLRTMRWKNIVWHPTVMMRRDVVDELNGYDAEALYVEDYDLWLRMLQKWRIEPLAEPLIQYRLHATQMTATKAIPQHSVEIIRASRLALARARGESLAAARIRQGVWSARQATRRLVRRH